MDPNEALKQLRAAVKDILHGEPACCAEHGEMSATDLAEKFEALDEWLTMGGFRPEEWP